MSAILVTGADLAPQALALLRDHQVVFAGKTPTEDDIVALCRAHNPAAIIVRYSKVGAAAMDAAPALQVVSKHGSGTDTIDKLAAKARGIAVVAAVGVNAAAVAEQALALLLACAKSVTTLDARMRGGHWDKAKHKSLELGGRTIGLVGLGAIGLRFAKMADALGMRVIGFDPFAKKLPDHVHGVDLETLWRESDAISLHCPLTDENRKLVNATTLARCKRGVILVNTARGGLIDEDALLAAVRSGQVMSAGLDSFAVEPMVTGHPFQGEPAIVLSPHIGGITSDAYVNMGVAAARNALQVLAHQPAAEIARLDALSTHHDVVHDGVRVRWRRFGGKDTHPPLVLLHGGHGSWMHWVRNIEALAARRTLWLPDLPGFNESDTPPPPASGEAPLGPLLAALGGTLDALVGARTVIDLGGFSFGGLVAAKFAVQRGAVRRLALMGSGGHGTLRRLTMEMINWRAAEDREQERAALLHNLGALMLHDSAAIDALAFEIHDISCHGTRFRSKEVSLAGGLQIALDAFAGRQLLLWGEHDVTADARSLVAQLVAGHAGREGLVVDGAGHWVQYERPDAINARLLQFLG